MGRTRPMKPYAILVPKVYYQNKWRKKTKGNWIAQIHLKTAITTEVVMLAEHVAFSDASVTMHKIRRTAASCY